MLTTTIQVNKAIWATDPSISVADRAVYGRALSMPPDKLAAALRSWTEGNLIPSAASTESRILRRQQVAERLDRSLRSIDALAAAGILHKVKFPGRTRAAGFLSSEIDRLLAGEVAHV